MVFTVNSAWARTTAAAANAERQRSQASAEHSVAGWREERALRAAHDASCVAREYQPPRARSQIRRPRTRPAPYQGRLAPASLHLELSGKPTHQAPTPKQTTSEWPSTP